MPISDSDENDDAAGFTLLEVLLVVGILALAATAIGRVDADAGARLSPEALERSALGLFRLARADAMVSGETRRVVVDPATSSLSIHELGRTLSFGDEVALAAVHAREASAGGEAAILFYPDGSSTGGSVALRSGGAERRVEIHWLTGRSDVRAP